MMKMNAWWRRGRWAQDLKQRANQLSAWPWQRDDKQSRQPRRHNLKQRKRPQLRDNQLNAQPQRHDTKQSTQPGWRNLNQRARPWRRDNQLSVRLWRHDDKQNMQPQWLYLNKSRWPRRLDLKKSTRQRREAGTCLGWPMKLKRNRGPISAEGSLRDVKRAVVIQCC